MIKINKSQRWSLSQSALIFSHVQPKLKSTQPSWHTNRHINDDSYKHGKFKWDSQDIMYCCFFRAYFTKKYNKSGLLKHLILLPEIVSKYLQSPALLLIFFLQYILIHIFFLWVWTNDRVSPIDPTQYYSLDEKKKKKNHKAENQHESPFFHTMASKVKRM